MPTSLLTNPPTLPPSSDLNDYPVLTTIKIGLKRTALEMHAALTAKGMKCGWPCFQIEHILATTSPTEQEVDLVEVPEKVLGLDQNDDFTAFSQKVQTLGLEIMTAEACAEFRIQYKAQPEGKFHFMGTKPPATGRNNIFIFYASNDHGTLGFHCFLGLVDEDEERSWVLIRPRK